MNRVVLDPAYLIALEASDDQHHEEAIRHWRQSLPEISSIVTTTYVFDEVVTFFNSRGHHGKAVEIGDRLLRSPRVEVIQGSEDLPLTGPDSDESADRSSRLYTVSSYPGK